MKSLPQDPKMKANPFAAIAAFSLASTIFVLAQPKPETPADPVPAPDQPSRLPSTPLPDAEPGSEPATPYFPPSSRRQTRPSTAAPTNRTPSSRYGSRSVTSANAPASSSNPFDAGAASPLAAASDLSGQAATSDSFTEAVLEEEGNLNLDAAMNSYQSIIAAFDKQRAQAANAVFRLGEVYRKMGRLAEAKIQYARVLREFPDLVELTRLSHQRLVADTAQTPMTATGLSGNSLYRQRLQQIVNRAERQPPLTGSTGRTDSNVITDPGQRDMLLRYGMLAPSGLPGMASAPSAANLPDDTAPDRSAATANAQQKVLLQQEIKLVEESLQTAKKKVEVGAMPPADLIPVERELLTLRRDLASMDDNREQQKELLSAEIKLVEQQRKTIESQAQNGKAGPEELNRNERELLGLRRKLVALDQPAATQNRLNTYPSLTTGSTAARSQRYVAGQNQTAWPYNDPNYPPTILPALPMESLRKEATDLQRRAREVRAELPKAEAELRQARQLLVSVQRSNPVSLPAPASSDPRYQSLKKYYQDDLLAGRQAFPEKLTNWVKQIYLPELDAQVEDTGRKVGDLRNEIADWENGVAENAARQRRESDSYRTIVTNLSAIHAAKEKWAREQGKQSGDPVTESDLEPYLVPRYFKTALPKPVDGETYQINPLGTPPSAKLARPLGDFPAGHVLELPTIAPRPLP